MYLLGYRSLPTRSEVEVGDLNSSSPLVVVCAAVETRAGCSESTREESHLEEKMVVDF